MDRARLALDASLFEPEGSLSALYFDLRRSLDLSPRSSATERLGNMRMGLTFYSHATAVYNFVEDEKLICDIKHLISMETQGLEEYSLGITLSTRPHGDLPWTQCLADRDRRMELASDCGRGGPSMPTRLLARGLSVRG